MSSIDDFDHPCKGTCSGWQQGFDKGVKAIDNKEVMSRFLHEQRMAQLKKSLISKVKFQYVITDPFPGSKKEGVSIYEAYRLGQESVYKRLEEA